MSGQTLLRITGSSSVLSNNSIYPRVLFPLSVMDVDIEKIRFKQIALTAHRYPAIYLSVSNADCLFLIH